MHEKSLKKPSNTNKTSNNKQGTNVAHNIMGGLQIIAMFHL